MGHDMEEGWEEAVLVGQGEAVDPHSNACPGRFSRASRASYALNANLVHKWLGDPRFVADCTANEDSAAETARFPPVEIEGVALSSALSQPAPSPSALDLTLSAQRVDLTLSDGRRILVEGTTALSAVLDMIGSLPYDPAKLKGLVSRMNEEIKSQAYQIEKLKAGLHGHRKARFGARSGSMDQLALDLQDDQEIEAAADARHAEQNPGDNDNIMIMKRPRPSRPALNVNTTAPRCPITWTGRMRFCRPMGIAVTVAVACARSARMSARMSPRSWNISPVALSCAGSSARAWPAPVVKCSLKPHCRRVPLSVAAPGRVFWPMC